MLGGSEPPRTTYVGSASEGVNAVNWELGRRIAYSAPLPPHFKPRRWANISRMYSARSAYAKYFRLRFRSEWFKPPVDPMAGYEGGVPHSVLCGERFTTRPLPGWVCSEHLEH
eukprot:5988750-Prymnesium_polylepis.1